MQTPQTQQTPRVDARPAGPRPVVPTPKWDRPDDAEREARLKAMKRRATGLLAVALVVFVVASWFESLYPWLGYVRATAEASLVGGLADWFAVTALFRRPLGLPIPHTALIPTRKDALAGQLGQFVTEHFLTAGNVVEHLRAAHLVPALGQQLSSPAVADRIRRETAVWAEIIRARNITAN